MKLKWVVAGVLVSIAMTFLLIFVIAAAEYFTDLGEGIAGILVYAAAAVSVFAGAFTAAYKAQGKALPHAAAVAFIYIAAMIIASVAINGRVNTDMHCLSIFAGVIAAGFLGAVCGRK